MRNRAGHIIRNITGSLLYLALAWDCTSPGGPDRGDGGGPEEPVDELPQDPLAITGDWIPFENYTINPAEGYVEIVAESGGISSWSRGRARASCRPWWKRYTAG